MGETFFSCVLTAKVTLPKLGLHYIFKESNFFLGFLSFSTFFFGFMSFCCLFDYLLKFKRSNASLIWTEMSMFHIRSLCFGPQSSFLRERERERETGRLREAAIFFLLARPLRPYTPPDTPALFHDLVGLLCSSAKGYH